MTNGRPPRDVVFLLVGAAVLYVAFWLAVRLRSLLLMLLISLFLAFALEPAANLLARRGWRRGLATAAVFVALIIGVVVFVAALGALLVDQVGALVDAIPGYARQITEFLNDTLGTELSGDNLAANLLGNPGVQDFVNGLAAAAVGLSTTLVGLILQGMTIGCSPSTWSPTAPGCVGRCARGCRPAASRSPCASGTWPSRAPAATSTRGRCWPPSRG